MDFRVVPLLIFVFVGIAIASAMLAIGRLVGPRRSGLVKQMPYESGMDPIHDTRRRFDVRFHLVAIAFLIFDVELLFLYPWAVASHHPAGIDHAVKVGMVENRGVVFAGVMFFLALVSVGLLYEWRRGVLRWR